ESTAVVFGEERLSYGELNRRANRLAHYLRELGVGLESRVGVCVERGLEMMVGVLGVLKAGGAYVPLDPGYPLERLSYMLEDSGAEVLLTQKHVQERLWKAELGITVVDLGEGQWQQSGQEQRDENITAGSIGVSSENVAYVIYTSGSTGNPK